MTIDDSVNVTNDTVNDTVNDTTTSTTPVVKPIVEPSVAPEFVNVGSETVADALGADALGCASGVEPTPVPNPISAATIVTLSDYAYQVVAKHYQQLISLEEQVLADQDPEYLHDMRVELRRLEMALRLFDRALALPKSIQRQRLQALARAMGKLRDLDVQLVSLRDRYSKTLQKSERPAVKMAVKALKKSRIHAFLRMKQVLFSTDYTHLKTGWETWLACPAYKPLAALPLNTLLPDLLSPLLSRLLLHPGWLISLAEISEVNSAVLHGLRKVCKRVRYQAEFFREFYDREFHAWIAEIKGVQSSLGTLHDCQVLQAQLTAILPKNHTSSGLQQAIAQDQQAAMAEWDTLRARYLQPEWRSHVRQLILHPKSGIESSCLP